MKQKLIELDKNETKFLLSLLESGAKSDAQISREIKVSKATTSRIRKKLEKNRIIEDYIPIIKLEKIGVEIFQVLLLQWIRFGDTKLSEKVFSEWEADPHIIFLAHGQGANFTTVLFMGFKDIHEYDEYSKQFRAKYSNYIGKTEIIILPSDKVIKNDYTHLVSHMLKKFGGA